MSANWDEWVEAALSKLESLKLLRSLRPINVSNNSSNFDGHAYHVFDSLRQWDRTSVEVTISDSTFRNWLNDIPSCGAIEVPKGEEGNVVGKSCSRSGKKLLLFSGNDYLGLSAHPTIRMAAAKAAQEHGMGPRGSALICGYTDYHGHLEASLAELKKKEDCLLCPTGFAANMAFIVAVGSIASLSASGRIPARAEKVAVFSDALNHASIIDGLRLGERLHCIETFVYRHCDMSHLDALLSDCTISKKVVVTDSLFSMDGDFAPMTELAKLRKKHSFLLVIDDAHGTFTCGEGGGGVAQEFDCESDVDICIGTLSKAAGCTGGFIACSKRWKQLVMSRGRSFIFSTAMPIPMAAAAHAATFVAEKEGWRRKAIQERVQDFRDLTGIPITSHIVSIIVGSEEKSLLASRHMLKSGFHVTAIRPPTVPPNSCRLRITLSAAHTRKDVKKLADALSRCINFQDIDVENTELLAKL
ncbi:8-amino-7-oxononanoate synthase isoform X1 [Spinacia oleracea]|uniref:8-amino-7-oxononanoate synthase isoform X1 n=2 Tax=Spinacia oleracea TaxID=3562 RepID=A0A9R0J6M6_SPIOL|nr:8-amino-7-oxononanoate synthase isoform X1 [Spinacia oleracea]